jgi:hypothetical protein
MKNDYVTARNGLKKHPNLSGLELAKKLGISPQVIYNIRRREKAARRLREKRPTRKQQVAKPEVNPTPALLPLSDIAALKATAFDLLFKLYEMERRHASV